MMPPYDSSVSATSTPWLCAPSLPLPTRIRFGAWPLCGSPRVVAEGQLVVAASRPLARGFHAAGQGSAQEPLSAYTIIAPHPLQAYEH